jgi:integrase
MGSNVVRNCVTCLHGRGSEALAGAIEQLPSGSLRVKVYAGYDPLTGRRHYLTEIVPAGPKAAAEADRVRTRLQSQVDERRNPTTRATVNQLLDRYLEVLDVEPTTRARHEGIIRVHIRPALGHLPLAKLDGDLLDRFYAQLRRCRERCDGKSRHVKHRTQREHECDESCVAVPCKPLSASSIRATHWILSAALARAVRWRWLGRNPIESTGPPAPVRSNPSPPSPAEAARLLNAAWEDPDWGAFVWTAMTTGARRGELCSLKREDVDLDAGTLFVRTGLKLVNGRLVRSETKTHQQRRIALDPETVEVLREYMARVDRRAELLDLYGGLLYDTPVE